MPAACSSPGARSTIFPQPLLPLPQPGRRWSRRTAHPPHPQKQLMSIARREGALLLKLLLMVKKEGALLLLLLLAEEE